MANLKKDEGKVINLRNKVQVKGIKHKEPSKQKLEVGKVYSVHPLQAENLIETGHAVKVEGKK